ncbi:MAG: leucine-rich repeat domain-containing protein [Bacteroidia bacterium]|nr:leucine-rich repeat domain-containing protein [Bacteroidia bacterium]
MLNRIVLLAFFFSMAAEIFAQVDSTMEVVPVDTSEVVMIDTSTEVIIPNPEIIPEAGPILGPTQLQRQKWYTSVQEAMAKPQEVYKLTLTGQKLTSIPNQVFYFSNIQVLDLGDNKIKLLPSEIAQLKNLQVLILTGNKLRFLPEEMKEMQNLHTLFVASNRLVEFPAWLGGLSKLRTLNVSSNNLTSYDIKLLEYQLPRCEIIH